MSEITTTNVIENGIAAIERGEMDGQEAIALLDHAKAAQEAAAEVVRRVKSALVQWIEANRDIEVGDVRYYVGVEKKTKPLIPPPAMFRRLAELLGGDEEATLACLASAAFKHGEVKGRLAESLGEQADAIYAELFETIEELELKTGKPKKSLQSVNKKFLK